MDGNNSYWLASAPAWPSAASALPDRAAVVVLGAGIMGAATAYWLARLGVRALVIERNAGPGAGATGRNAGLHVPGAADGYADTTERLGRVAARAITTATETNRHLLEAVLARESIAADYRQTAFVALAAAGEEAVHAQQSAALLREDGFAAQWLDRAEAEAAWGSPLAEQFAGALFNPSGAALHSARYTQGVAQAAQRLGAQFCFGSTVTGVDQTPNGWEVMTTNGTVQTPQVVVAVNAWAGELFAPLATILRPVRGHILVTEPVAALAAGRLRPWSANAGFEYGQQLPDGRLLIGGRRKSRPDREEGYAPAPGQNAPPVEPSVVAALAAVLPELIPPAAGAAASQHWAGVMDFSPDHQPLAGPWPGRPGLWLLVGFSGHGMPFSQVLPYALAAQMAGAEGPAVPEAFGPGRWLG